MTATPATLEENERMIQIRSIDPAVKRAMRIEAATRNVTFGQLLSDMWNCYRYVQQEEER